MPDCSAVPLSAVSYTWSQEAPGRPSVHFRIRKHHAFRVFSCLVADHAAQLVVEPKAIGQVINIGNKHEITIQALAERVRELSGSSSPIKLIPYDEAYESGFEDMPRRVPDLTRVKGLIGYEPTLELDEILTQVIDYFRKK